MQLSIVISESILALVTIGVALRLFQGGFIYSAGPGFILVALAALLGAIKFSGVESVISAHKQAALLAATVGMPMVGYAFLGLKSNALQAGSASLIAWFILLALSIVLVNILSFIPYARIIAVVGLLAIIIIAATFLSSSPRAALTAIAGALTIVLTGLAIGTKGELFGLKRVDLYHYGLALGNLLIGLGLLKLK